MTPSGDNTSDHRAILDELKRLREDFKQVINVTQTEQRQHRVEVREEFEAIREVIKEMTGLIHRVDKNSEKALLLSADNKRVIWLVGGGAISVALIAMAKALGFY